jgi:hypothetical protein
MARGPGKGKTNNPNGRPKGSTNKMSATVKEALLKTYDEIGGDARFALWAAGEPTEFYKLFAKMLPKEMEVAGAGGGPLSVSISFVPTK